MRKIVLQNATTILLQNASAFLLQEATVLLQNATVTTKSNNFITKRVSYYKMRRLLQNVSVFSLKACILCKVHIIDMQIRLKIPIFKMFEKKGTFM